MKVKVNQKEVETAATTLSELLSSLGMPATGVAVAVDGRLVPRAEWERCALTEGQALVVVKAACGG